MLVSEIGFLKKKNKIIYIYRGTLRYRGLNSKHLEVIEKGTFNNNSYQSIYITGFLNK